MSTRIVVVGGDATGMSAANTALRHAQPGEVEVVVVERGHYTSYSACGIPYWIAGDVADGDQLIARTPEQHREAGIDVRMRTEATAIDLEKQTVSVRGVDDGSTEDLSYDELVLATGAVPTVPPLDGVDAEGIFGVQSLEQGEAIVKDMADGDRRRAVVVGAGYIGVEMAEAMVNRGLETTILDHGPRAVHPGRSGHGRPDPRGDGGHGHHRADRDHRARLRRRRGRPGAGGPRGGRRPDRARRPTSSSSGSA